MSAKKRDFIAENIKKYSEQPHEPKTKEKMVKKKKTTTACKGEIAGTSARDSKHALEGTSGKSETLRRSPRIKDSAQFKSKEPKTKEKMVKKKKTTTTCKGEIAGTSARDSKHALEGTSGKSETLRRSPRIKDSAQFKSKIPIAVPRKRPAGNTMKGSGQPTPPKVQRLAESPQIQEEGQREEGASAPNPDEGGAPDPMLERRVRWASTPPRLSIIYEEEEISQKRSSDEQSSSHEMQAPLQPMIPVVEDDRFWSAVEEDPESRD